MALIDDSNKHTVKYSKYNMEFENFYDHQVSLCDKLSGSRIIYYVHKQDNQEKEITPLNFKEGIFQIKAFVYNYIHYVDALAVKDDIRTQLYNLENEFNNDEEYKRYIKLKNNSRSYLIGLNKKYFYYLKKSYELINYFTESLQTTLMVGTDNIAKKVSFVNSEKFFMNISQYRNGSSNLMANYSFENAIDVFKKILGYHYTYRMFLDEIEVNKIDNVVKGLTDVLISSEYLTLYNKYETNQLTTTSLKDAKLVEDYIFKAISTIYELTNESLSYVNILPELKRKVLRDKTGI